MSSTIVCQNLMSCFDSSETTATLKLKVAPPLPPPPMAVDDRTGIEFGNWGFLQTSIRNSGDVKETSYYKANTSSFSKLSPKSLELCTENLGSESGADTVSDSGSIFSTSPPFSPSADFPTSLYPAEHDDWRPKTKNTQNRGVSGCRKTKNFPPPLTTSSSLRRHREGGRLIIEAVETPFRNSYLQVERCDGRLKLCFWMNSDAAETTSSSTSAGSDEEPAAEEEECDAGEEVETENEENEELDGEINLEIEMEKYQRFSRCKEGSHGNKGYCNNWKPALWVATS